MKRIVATVLIGAACGLLTACPSLPGPKVTQVIDRLSGGSQQVVQGDPVDVALADAMSNVIPTDEAQQGGGL